MTRGCGRSRVVLGIEITHERGKAATDITASRICYEGCDYVLLRAYTTYRNIGRPGAERLWFRRVPGRSKFTRRANLLLVPEWISERSIMAVISSQSLWRSQLKIPLARLDGSRARGCGKGSVSDLAPKTRGRGSGIAAAGLLKLARRKHAFDEASSPASIPLSRNT